MTIVWSSNGWLIMICIGCLDGDQRHDSTCSLDRNWEELRTYRLHKMFIHKWPCRWHRSTFP
jgi:hypothetical protein